MNESHSDKTGRLPRGPHALPPEVVVANQRVRLLDAAAAAIAETGYAELSVRELIDRAGVSRRTFYQLFHDKSDCVLAAHERAFERLSKIIVEACRADHPWPRRVAAAIAASLEFAVKDPDDAYLVVVACHTAPEPTLANRGHAAHEKLADLLRAGRQEVDMEHQPPPLSEQAAIGAVTTVVGTRLLAGDLEALPGLAPELTEVILTPFLGPEGAQDVAGGAAA